MEEAVITAFLSPEDGVMLRNVVNNKVVYFLSQNCGRCYSKSIKNLWFQKCSEHRSHSKYNVILSISRLLKNANACYDVRSVFLKSILEQTPHR